MRWDNYWKHEGLLSARKSTLAIDHSTEPPFGDRNHLPRRIYGLMKMVCCDCKQGSSRKKIGLWTQWYRSCCHVITLSQDCDKGCTQASGTSRKQFHIHQGQGKVLYSQRKISCETYLQSVQVLQRERTPKPVQPPTDRKSVV